MFVAINDTKNTIRLYHFRGGDPHYTDTGEPPGAQLLDLHDDGEIDHQIVIPDA